MTEFITKDGMKLLEDEFNHLWRIERPKVVQGVSDAAAEGDRSENAEYIYGKKRLREIDRKLRHLGSRLKILKIAPLPPKEIQSACFGCWVTYEDTEGNERCYQLVGADEFDVSKGMISVKSPVGQALLGKKVDDELTIRRPIGDLHITITSISAKRSDCSD